MPMHHPNPFAKENQIARRDTVVGFMITGGLHTLWSSLFLVVVFAFGAHMFGDAGTRFFNFLKWVPVFAGVVYLSGLILGIYLERTEYTGKREIISGCRIIARYAMTRDHRMVTDESEFEFLDRPKFFVKILSPKTGSVEYQCVHPVFLNCGEGMMGDAEIEGQWLGSFRPYPPGYQNHVGQRF
jgi:hypothetical protein